MSECTLPSFYRYSGPTARKRYRCVECRAPILAGEKHFACTGCWDGSVSSHRQHLECMEACILIRDEFDGECIPFGGLKEWWGEYHMDLQDGKKSEKGKKLRSLMAKILWRERRDDATNQKTRR